MKPELAIDVIGVASHYLFCLFKISDNTKQL